MGFKIKDKKKYHKTIMKIGNFKLAKGDNYDLLFGAFCTLIGCTITSAILKISGFYNRWFFFIFSGIFAILFQLKLFKSWIKLRTKQNKSKEVMK